MIILVELYNNLNPVRVSNFIDIYFLAEKVIDAAIFVFYFVVNPESVL